MNNLIAYAPEPVKIPHNSYSVLPSRDRAIPRDAVKVQVDVRDLLEDGNRRDQVVKRRD